MIDYSSCTDLLAQLQATISEEEKSWMLMEFSLSQLSPVVSEAVWAAAIPCQFDEPLLNALLETNLTAEELKTLLSQSYIEHLWDGGYAVHESTRKLLLAKMFQDDPQHYLELNRRATKYSEQRNQSELFWKVATLYHQVLANIDWSEDEFDDQASDWWDSGFPLDKLDVLIRPMLEEVNAQRVSDAMIAHTYYWQGVLDIYLHGHPSSAKNYLTQALSLYQQIGYENKEASCIEHLGNAHLHLLELDEARMAYEQSLTLYQRLGGKIGAANCIYGLGDIHLERAEFDAARETYQQALLMYQQVGDKRGEANCILSLGDVYTDQGQFDLAISTLTQAAQQYHAIDFTVDEANCLDRIANIYHNQQYYVEALEIYQQAIDIYSSSGLIYRNRANTYIQMEQYDLATENLLMSEAIEPDSPYLFLRRGEIALAQHQPQTAVDLLQHATQQRPKDGGFQCGLALALLANGNAEAFATMETGLKLTYRKKDVENWLEDLDKLVRIYGERAEFTQMSALITDYLTQRFPTSA